MTRIEFIKQLEQLLKDLPEHDRQDAIAYYEDYFDEAGPENEASVIQELGSPEKVAANIKREAVQGGNEQAQYTERGYSDGSEGVKQTPVPKKKSRKPLPLALVIIILIFGLPVWGGLLSGLLGAVLGVFGAALGILAAMAAVAIVGVVCGVILIVASIIELLASPAVGILGIGIGLVLIAIALLILVLFLWIIIKAIPAVFRFFVDLIQKLIYKVRGGNRNE